MKRKSENSAFCEVFEAQVEISALCGMPYIKVPRQNLSADVGELSTPNATSIWSTAATTWLIVSL